MRSTCRLSRGLAITAFLAIFTIDPSLAQQGGLFGVTNPAPGGSYLDRTVERTLEANRENLLRAAPCDPVERERWKNFMRSQGGVRSQGGGVQMDRNGTVVRSPGGDYDWSWLDRPSPHCQAAADLPRSPSSGTEECQRIKEEISRSNSLPYARALEISIWYNNNCH